MTETIDRYLRTMKRYLPRAERDDIAAELSANIYAEVEDEERRVGRPLTVAECSAMLQAYGHPIAVALRYSGNTRSFTFGWQIVGPELFPSYVWVLALNVSIACCIAVAAAIYGIPSWTGAPNVLAHVVVQVAIVTAVFAALQAAFAGRIDASASTPRLKSLCAFVFTLGANLVLIEVLRNRDVAPGDVLTPAPAWHAVVLTYAIFVLVELARNAVNLYRPALARFRAISIVASGAVALVGCAIALGSGALVVPADPRNADAVRLAGGVNLMLDVCFASAAAIAIGTIAWQLRVARRKTSVPKVIPFAVFALACVSLGTGTTKAEARCAVAPFAVKADGAAWNGWGADLSQSRFQTAAMAALDPASVPRLKLKWAFGFPGATRAYGQPTIFGGRVFVGSENHHVYALDAATGCLAWDFDAGASVRTAISVGRVGGRWIAYFGDQRANAFALDAASGERIWKTHVDEHPAAIVTGAPALAGNTLYVPVSSNEEASAADPKYTCCTFRGSLVALDSASGAPLWKSFTVSATSHQSGAAIWSAPAVDVEHRIAYVTTGDSYSDPAAPASDALLAFDTTTGRTLWIRQLTANDAENLACGLPAPYDSNCPKANGPDYDFGSSPVLVTLHDGRRLVVVAQKSGMVYALDPARKGAPLWSTRVGQGSKLGGVQWGFASGDDALFVAVSDVKVGAAAPGVTGAQMTAFGIPFAMDPNAGGGLVALDVATGAVRWRTPNPGCNGRSGCSPAQSAAVTAIPGIAFSGSLDGHLRAYATANGRIVWDVDTEHAYATVNGAAASGGSLDGPGPTVAGGMLYVDSGSAFLGTIPGNVLLAFSVDGM